MFFIKNKEKAAYYQLQIIARKQLKKVEISKEQEEILANMDNSRFIFC